MLKTQHPRGFQAFLSIFLPTRFREDPKSIPYGATLSYSDISRRTGKPYAVRATARAIVTNPDALLISCHREIRNSGDLAGYRWGIECKAALLDLEKAHVTKPARAREIF